MTLLITPYGSDDPNPLVLQPESKDDDDVHLVVGNLSDEGWKAVLEEGTEFRGQELEPDESFKAYYRLLEEISANQPIPHPPEHLMGKFVEPEGLRHAIAPAWGGGPVRCPQALYAPSANA